MNEYENQVKEEEKVEETIQEQAPRKNKSGSNKIIIVIMGIIIVLLLAVILFLLLTGNDKKETKANDENAANQEQNNNQDKPNVENVVVSKEKISDITFAGIECGGTDFVFVKDTVLVDNISVKNKLGMLSKALLKLIDTQNIEAGQDVELDIDIYEIAKKYFDVTPEMEKQMEEGFGTDFYIFTYKNNKSYINIIIGGCIGPMNEGEYTRFKESKVSGNTLIETYYYFYLKNDDGDDEESFTSSYYKDKNDTNPIYSKVSSGDSLDYSKFDTYDVYFDTTDGNMKLIKIVYNAS